ncbi:MAG: hypothetical protein SVV80_05770 [Planctomycetota bacterium]|nr:hypothetical protein [Planctomycetota bacterium]
MKDRNEHQSLPGEDACSQDESAEHLGAKPGEMPEEDERECIPEPDEESLCQDFCDDWDDVADEDDEFDDEDWDDTWDEDDYRDRQDRDSGMRRHRKRHRDSDDSL